MPKAPSLPASQGAPENVIAPSTWTSDWQSAPGLWKRNRHGAPTELDATKQWFANFATRSWRTTASCVSHPVTMGTLCLQNEGFHGKKAHLYCSSNKKFAGVADMVLGRWNHVPAEIAAQDTHKSVLFHIGRGCEPDLGTRLSRPNDRSRARYRS